MEYLNLMEKWNNIPYLARCTWCPFSLPRTEHCPAERSTKSVYLGLFLMITPLYLLIIKSMMWILLTKLIMQNLWPQFVYIAV